MDMIEPEEAEELESSNVEEEAQRFIVPDDSPQEVVTEILEEAATVECSEKTTLVCDECYALNLVERSTSQCEKCERPFCFHYISAVDARYCVECMSEITLERSEVTKTYEHINPTTKEKTTFKRRARSIKLSGLDWLFAQRRIATLSDTELDLAIEYHRTIMGLLLAEQERQRNAVMHRYAGVAIKIPKPIDLTTVTEQKSTVTKTKKVISKSKVEEKLAASLKALLAKGMTAEQILKMVKK